MTLSEKVGQLLMPGIARTWADDEAAMLINTYHVGGIWLTSRNILSVGQAAELVSALAGLGAAGDGIPLLFSVDHEGGMINRFPYDGEVTAFPSLMALGAAGSGDLAYQMGYVQARELRRLGFNMDLAPVLDVNLDPQNPVIGIRSFGSDPARVAELGDQYILGLRAGGVIAVAKHFPGHGNVSVDSHFYLPVVLEDQAALDQGAAVPFRSAIAHGLPGVMMGHLAVPAIDASLPASLSGSVVTGYLRDELGFDGLVVSDDIRMRAILRHYPAGEAAVLAVLAGVDVVPINSLEPALHTGQVHSALMAAVQSGRLTEARLESSVRRVLTLKAAYGLLDVPAESPSAETETLNGAQVAADIGRLSITLARDTVGLLPLPASARLLVITPDDGLRVYYRDAYERTPLGLALGDAGFQVRELTYRAKSFEAQAEVYWQAISLADQYDAVLMGTWDAAIPTMGSSAWQQQLVAELLLRNPKLIGLALRTPYDVDLFPAIPTFLATYGGVPTQMRALAAVLSGEEAPMGVFPVEVGLGETAGPNP